jgi:hypothetical protein
MQITSDRNSAICAKRSLNLGLAKMLAKVLVKMIADSVAQKIPVLPLRKGAVASAFEYRLIFHYRRTGKNAPT